MSYVRFSQFESTTDKNGIELVGVKNGKNVRIPAENLGGGGTGGGIGEAPDDGKAYVRRSTEWVQLKQTSEYTELPTKAVINAIPRETKISLIKQRGYDPSGECFLSVRIDNANIIKSASDGYFADCKLFLLRMKRKKSYVGLDQGDEARDRKYSGRAWAETGVGLSMNTYDHDKITGDLSEFWPQNTYMWDVSSEIIELFGGRDLKNIDALPPGLRASLITYNVPGDKIPLGIGQLLNRYVRDMPADATYSDVDFKLTSYKSNLTCATFGIALYKKMTERNTKGHSWERISNIAAFKIKQDSKGQVKVTIL